MLGSWFSCWMEQYDRPLWSICAVSHFPLHTQADTIHRAVVEGSPALFMRCIAQNATGISWEFKTAHTVFGLLSVSCSHTHTIIYTCYKASIYPLWCFSLAELQLFKCDLGCSWRAAGICSLTAELQGFMWKEWYHLHVREAERLLYGQATLNHCYRNGVCQVMESHWEEKHI